MTAQCEEGTSIGRIPNLDQMVYSCGSHPATIRLPCDRIHLASMCLPLTDQGPIRGTIHAAFSSFSAQNKLFPIWIPRHRGYVCRARNFLNDVSGCLIPDLQPLRSGGRQQFSIRMVRHRENATSTFDHS